MHYTEQLRVLTLGDPRRVGELAFHEQNLHQSEARVFAVARLGALIAHGGSVSSYGPEIEAALEQLDISGDG